MRLFFFFPKDENLGYIKSNWVDLCVSGVVVEKVHRHGYSTTDQRGRPGGSGPMIATEYSTSTSFLKSDQWSLLKKEVEVRSLTKN